MALVVLGLDALDWWLADDFGCDVFRLKTSQELESFAYTFDDRPHTLDVWPSIATGLHPTEHGVDAFGTWDNPVVQWGSIVVNRLESVLGRSLPGTDTAEAAAKAAGSEWSAGTVDVPTFFDGPGREVQNWPGVWRNEMMFAARGFLKRGVHDGHATTSQFRRRIRAEAAGKFAWVREMMNSEAVLIANHIHHLDCAGHAFADDKPALAQEYEWAADHVRRIKNRMNPEDVLLLLSDHGMETEWKADNRSPADHSWRAIVSSTSDSVPNSVFDVHDWVEERIPEYSEKSPRQEFPEEQLRELGYL